MRTAAVIELVDCMLHMMSFVTTARRLVRVMRLSTQRDGRCDAGQLQHRYAFYHYEATGGAWFAKAPPAELSTVLCPTVL